MSNASAFGAVLCLAVLVAFCDWIFPEWGIPDWVVNLSWMVIAVFILLILMLIVVAAIIALHEAKDLP